MVSHSDRLQLIIAHFKTDTIGFIIIVEKV